MYEQKIKSLGELKDIAEELRKKGKKIVHCHGCFDILHFGHIYHFTEAKKQGDILIVTITQDQFVKKGPGRPFFNEDIRLKTVAAIGCVDYVALNKWETAVETINILKPDVYVKDREVLNNKEVDVVTSDEKRVSNLAAEERAVNSLGGKLYLTDGGPFSSSRIINQITNSIPDEAKLYLADFKKKYNAESIIKNLESLKDIKILVIGDAILDEYNFCGQMERSGKDHLVAFKSLSSELHAGGVFAVANHLAAFTPHVSLVTCMGRNSHYEFIKSKLKQEIRANILFQEDSETLIKKRYVENAKKVKLFELYSSEGVSLSTSNEKEVISNINRELPFVDIVLIADFGHGFMTPAIIDLIQRSNKFIALNCQLNAGNLGYNFITKYSVANFVSVNERELRLPLQDKLSDIHNLVERLSALLSCPSVNVTIGRGGNIYYSYGIHSRCPSFTKDVVDVVGAGDAILSLLSLLAYKKVEPEVVAFLNNCAGAIAVQTFGNQKYLNTVEINKFIQYILK